MWTKEEKNYWLNWIQQQHQQSENVRALPKTIYRKLVQIIQNGLELNLLPHLMCMVYMLIAYIICSLALSMYAAPFNWKARSLTFGACILCEYESIWICRVHISSTKIQWEWQIDIYTRTERYRGQRTTNNINNSKARKKRVYPTNIATTITIRFFSLFLILLFLFFTSREKKKSNYRNIISNRKK